MFKKLVTVLVVAFAVSAVHIAPTSAADAERHAYATYNGRIIDLAVSWEGAEACAVTDSGNACFDSEAEMDASTFVALATEEQRVSTLSTRSSCASPVRLYDGTSYTGTSIAFSTRGAFISLSAYGFANVTSSYKIGACSAAFYDGGGALYPGNTGAGVNASSMLSGWSNRVTTIYIN